MRSIARHVLKLTKLRPLDEATDAADYGTLVHGGLHHFLAEFGARWPADAPDRLRRAMMRALQEADLREALAAWWAPRLERIAEWVAGIEAERRADAPARCARRGSEWNAGTGAAGRTVPAQRPCRSDRAAAMRAGWPSWTTRPAPRRARRKWMPAWRRNCCWKRRWRRPVRSAIRSAGASEELTYWHLTGGFHAGEERTLFKARCGSDRGGGGGCACGAEFADRRI